MKTRNWILFGGIILLSIGAYASEDLGLKVGAYAVKNNRKTWEEDRFGNRTNYEYNKEGQLVNIKLSDAIISGNIYKNGLLHEQINASGAKVQMNYDSLGRLIEKLTPAGKSGFKYDKYERMIERHGAGDYPLQFAYTGWGELAGYIDGNAAAIRFVYNQHGNIIKHIWPNGSTVNYGYTKNLLTGKEEAGRKTVYVYDDYGRMIEEKITQEDQSLTTMMTYDKNNRLTSITDGKNTIKFAYDRFGRKLLEEGPIGTVSMMYDAKGRLVARQIQLRKTNEKFLTEYDYDEFDRVIFVKSPSGEFNYTWTKDNKIATQSIGNKLVANTYDKAGRLVSKTFGDTILSKYEYDTLDRRTKGQYFDIIWDYSYDQHNQLIEAKNSKGANYIYTYDTIGNRLDSTENGNQQKFSYNQLNQIVNDGYIYDYWGNMIRTPDAEYLYDIKNRLIKIKKLDGTIIQYEYDPQDQRISSTINGNKRTDFLMSGMIEYARHDGETQYHTLGLDLLGSLEKTGAVGAILATNLQCYLYDGNGNIIAVEKDGNITEQIFYEPFGKKIVGINLPFTFGSKSVDQSEMGYYGYRFYNSAYKTWMMSDFLYDVDFYNRINSITYSSPDQIKIIRQEREKIAEPQYVFAKNSPINNFDIIGFCSAAEITACYLNCSVRAPTAAGFTSSCTKTLWNRICGTTTCTCQEICPQVLCTPLYTFMFKVKWDCTYQCSTGPQRVFYELPAGIDPPFNLYIPF